MYYVFLNEIINIIYKVYVYTIWSNYNVNQFSDRFVIFYVMYVCKFCATIKGNHKKLKKFNKKKN